MIKKILIFLVCLLLTGCSSPIRSDNLNNIPAKYNIDGVSIEDSSVNTQNVDNYLFRDDVIYVDLRPYAEVIKEGHIAGFSFYPFYDFIANKEGTKDSEGNPIDNRLFKMKNEKGMLGQIGNYVPNYKESEFVLNDLFPKDKYIFAITISCNESIYFFNLLIQYGYDTSLLYNIGGFSISTGLENKAYVQLENPKHLVKGNPFIPAVGNNVSFDFFEKLTPIVND